MKKTGFLKNLSLFAAGALAVSAFQYFKRKKNKPPNSPSFFKNFVSKWKTKLFPPETMNCDFSRRLANGDSKTEYDSPHKDFHTSVISRFGLPTQKEVLAFHDEFIVSTDTEKKIPNWVIEQYDRKNFRKRGKSKDEQRRKEIPR